jgi:hypothetical protein
MKKLLVLIIAALVAAAAIWIGLRMRLSSRAAAVTELLPKGTIILLHLPDYNRTRDQWHASDIYQIWREPSVQAFLEKPLAKVPKNTGAHETLQKIAHLEPKNTFVALTSLENNEPKIIAGFHFERNQADVEDLIGKWRSGWLAKEPAAKRETITYEGHQIDSLSLNRFMLASAYERSWFFASNDLAALKSILDRADHRGADADTSLKADETFASSFKHMPSDYAAFIYLQPKPFMEKLLPLLAMTGRALSPGQTQRLEQIRSFCGSFGFDHGKMHEFDFVGSPRIGPEAKLTRDTLSLATSETFLYSATLLDWPSGMQLPSASVPSGVLTGLQEILAVLSAQGITLQEWKTAFGEELGIHGDWSPNARWPSLFATLPIKDNTKARRIAAIITSVDQAGASWTREEKNGIAFYSLQAFGGFVPVQPTIAVSDKLLVAGLDSAAVEQAMKRSGTASELAKSQTYKTATAAVPAPDRAFAYIDSRLFFERLDSSMRPVLMMAAAFSSAINQSVDLKKLPPPETISKHLSPIVMSRTYQSDGYLTESIGPVTLNQATIGLVAAFGGVFAGLEQRVKTGATNFGLTASPSPAATSLPTGSAAASPTDSPK